jgi:hypothetical protein
MPYSTWNWRSTNASFKLVIVDMIISMIISMIIVHMLELDPRKTLGPQDYTKVWDGINVRWHPENDHNKVQQNSVSMLNTIILMFNELEEPHVSRFYCLQLGGHYMVFVCQKPN